MNDTISRQAAIDVLEAKKDKSAKGDIGCFYNKIIQNDIDALKGLPSAQPIDPVMHGKWNVIKKRPMDEEERREWSERLGYDIEYEDAFIYTNLPDDGEGVLICYSWGSVTIDTFRDDDGCYFEDAGDIDGIVAWMPLPKPYKGGEDETD